MIYRAFISTLLIYEMDCLTVDMKGLKAPETMKSSFTRFILAFGSTQKQC